MIPQEGTKISAPEQSAPTPETESPVDGTRELFHDDLGEFLRCPSGDFDDDDDDDDDDDGVSSGGTGFIIGDGIEGLSEK